MNEDRIDSYSPRSTIRLLAVAVLGASFWVALVAGAPAESRLAWVGVESADSVSLAEQIFPILEARCVECHGAVGDDGEPLIEEGLDLRTYESLMAGSTWGTVVEAGDLEGSLLYEMVESGEMPEEGDPLSEEETQLIADWISGGA